MAKLYLVEFTHKATGQQFQKIGWCAAYDVLERFSASTSERYGNSPEQYDAYSIRVLASAYSRSIDEVKAAEANLKHRYPKNLWIDDTFVGITEITNMNPDQRDQAIWDVKSYNNKWRSTNVEHQTQAPAQPSSTGDRSSEGAD